MRARASCGSASSIYLGLFASRRRHTRCSRDWSSDVCSSDLPFVKVEASKYTEVGYVGRDVESMVRDLVETAIDMVREEKLDEVAERAEQAAEERVLDLLLPPTPVPGDGASRALEVAHQEQVLRTREKLRAQL